MHNAARWLQRPSCALSRLGVVLSSPFISCQHLLEVCEGAAVQMGGDSVLRAAGGVRKKTTKPQSSNKVGAAFRQI